jgi:putative component of toxin-antitoxin plasmid stabilization module
MRIEIRQTEVFASWFADLRDREARARILVRIRRLSLGNPGDVKPVGGGDKRTQDRDIREAIALAREI